MSADSESILIVSQYFPPETGAAATRWDELSRRWNDTDDVTVLTSTPDYPSGQVYDGYENRWLYEEDRVGVRVLYTKTIPSSSGNLLRRSLKFVWFMLLATIVGLRYTNPTCVVASSPQPLTGVAAWIVARLNGARFVFEVRDLWPESVVAVSDFDNPVVIRGLDWTVIFLYRHCDILVIVSQAFVDPIVAEGVDEAKIRYHPNGVNPNLYSPDIDSGTTTTGNCGAPMGTTGDEERTAPDTGAEESGGLASDPPIPPAVEDSFSVAYVGTIGRAHGLSVLVPVAEVLPEVQFLVIGDGAERDRLAAATAPLNNVHLVGRRPKAEVPAFLAAADAVLVHLKPRQVFETVIPTKLLEGMAAGRPILLGVAGEARRILETADAGIPVTPDDDEELVEAIRELRDNPDRRRRFGANGRSYVTEHFAWDRIAERYRADVAGTREINEFGISP